jgi:hypothetical protein
MTYLGLIYFFSVCFGIYICFSEAIFSDEVTAFSAFKGTYDGLEVVCSGALMLRATLDGFWGSGAFSIILYPSRTYLMSF